MGEQAVEQMMAVLLDALRDDERRAGVQLAEHLYAYLLRINEPVLLCLIERVCADCPPSLGFQSLGQNGFHSGLFRPAFLVGGEPQVAIRHQIYLFGLELIFHRRVK